VNANNNNKYTVMSREQNAGRNHSMEMDNNSFDRVEQFKHLGKILTYENFILEEVKSRLKSENVCYHSVLNPLLFQFAIQKCKN